MAFSAGNFLGSRQNKTADQASSALTLAASASAGQYVVLLVAVDNAINSTSEASVTGVTDSGSNTGWVKLGVRSWPGSAQAGVNIEVWGCLLTTGLSSGGSITAAFGTAASRDASVLSAQAFSIGAGSTVAVDGTTSTRADTNVVGSMDVTTANAERLRIRAQAFENSATTGVTQTAGWSPLYDTTTPANATTSGGSGATNALLRGEYRIITATGAASAPGWTTTGDSTSIYLTLAETAGAPTGTLSGTETGTDTASVSGTVAVSGSLAATESGTDTASMAGGPIVSGSLSATESGTDTAAIDGTVQGDEVTGTLAATETGTDTATITGGPIASGTLSSTETGADTASVTGGPTVAGSVAAAEVGADSASIAGGPTASGALAATESPGSDTAAVAGSVAVAGTLSATEAAGQDTATATGAVLASGGLSATEAAGGDAASITASAAVDGSLSATEAGQDATSITGEVVAEGPSGALSATETGTDTASISGGPIAAGSLAAQESGSDTAGLSGAVTVAGAVAASETGQDTAAVDISVNVDGAMAATETGQDTATITGPGALDDVTGTLSATESGSDAASILETVPEEELPRGGPGLPYYDRKRKKPAKPTLEELLADLTEEEAAKGPTLPAPEITAKIRQGAKGRTTEGSRVEPPLKGLTHPVKGLTPRALTSANSAKLAEVLQPGFRKIRQAEAERISAISAAEETKRRRRRAAALLLLH